MQLVYHGGSTLTFGTESGSRRTVKRGEPFEVGDELGAILLADPDVAVALEAATEPASNDVPRETPLAEKSKAELLVIAGGLGLELPKRATNPSIVEAIEAEQTRLAEEAATEPASNDGESNQGGDATPGDDPAASATGEPGTPPSETGPITLGDLPDGTRIAREPS